MGPFCTRPTVTTCTDRWRNGQPKPMHDCMHMRYTLLAALRRGPACLPPNLSHPPRLHCLPNDVGYGACTALPAGVDDAACSCALPEYVPVHGQRPHCGAASMSVHLSPLLPSPRRPSLKISSQSRQERAGRTSVVALSSRRHPVAVDTLWRKGSLPSVHANLIDEFLRCKQKGSHLTH